MNRRLAVLWCRVGLVGLGWGWRQPEELLAYLLLQVGIPRSYHSTIMVARVDAKEMKGEVVVVVELEVEVVGVYCTLPR